MPERSPRLIVPFLLSCAVMTGGLVILGLIFGAFVDALVYLALNFVPAVAAFRAGMMWRRHGRPQPAGKRVAMAAGRAGAMVFWLVLALAALFLVLMLFLLGTTPADDVNRGYIGAALIIAFAAPPVYLIYAAYALWFFLTCWAGLLLGHAWAGLRGPGDANTRA